MTQCAASMALPMLSRGRIPGFVQRGKWSLPMTDALPSVTASAAQKARRQGEALGGLYNWCKLAGSKRPSRGCLALSPSSFFPIPRT